MLERVRRRRELRVCRGASLLGISVRECREMEAGDWMPDFDTHGRDVRSVQLAVELLAGGTNRRGGLFSGPSPPRAGDDRARPAPPPDSLGTAHSRRRLQNIEEAATHGSSGLDADDVFVPRIEGKQGGSPLSIPAWLPLTLHPDPFHISSSRSTHIGTSFLHGCSSSEARCATWVAPQCLSGGRQDEGRPAGMLRRAPGADHVPVMRGRSGTGS
jgi:hypothetical protein